MRWPWQRRHPPLPPGRRLNTFDEAQRALETGDADGLGLVVTDALRAAIADERLRELQARGIALFDALGRELTFNRKGKLIPLRPDDTPGIG